ncbi:unnamed protein product [Moneuplotes crassus]|uniref:UDENN domain-containing protein n=1 Tax=Euplotes crassus TaxID=5936 RepID=A0AAD1XSM7_EUPCR|nr:unnamed protein product [Moneuplotes crassus]
MIDTAYLTGINMLEVAHIILDIMTGEDVCEKSRTPTFIDRIPRKDSIRSSEDASNERFPITLNSFVFWEGCQVKADNPGHKLVPLVLTNLNDQRRYGQALIFYEKLEYYIPLLKSCIKERNYESFGSDIFTDISQINTKRLDPKFLRKSVESEEGSSVSIRESKEFKKKFNIFSLVDELISDLEGINLEFYLPKALILMSECPLYVHMAEILESVYTNILTGSTEYPLDLYLIYLTHCVPLPTYGTHITYSLCDNKTVDIEYPSLNQLPYVCTDFYFNFFAGRYLSFESLKHVLYWLLTQMGSIFVVSKDTTKIVETTEVIRTLIFPFEYRDIYILSLSSDLYCYCESPFPLLIGIPDRDGKDIQSVIEQASDLSLIIDLDNNELIVKFNEEDYFIKDFIQFPFQDRDYFYKLKYLPFTKHINELGDQIERQISIYYEKDGNPDYDRNISKQIFVSEIRRAFLTYFCYVFNDYRDHLKKEKDLDPEEVENNIRTIIKEKPITKKYIKNDFYRDFLETRYWIDFLAKLCNFLSPTLEDKARIKLFDEYILLTKSNKGLKKILSIFQKQQSKKELWVNQTYPKNDYSKLFIIENIQEEKKINKNGIVYGQTMEFCLNIYYDTISEKEGIFFRDYLDIDEDNQKFCYKIIPEFCSEYIPDPYNFKPHCREFRNFPPEFKIKENPEILDIEEFKNFEEPEKNPTEVERIYDIEISTNEGEVYLTWVIMWCITFEFIPTRPEKFFRVYQLNGILLKLRDIIKDSKKWTIIFKEILRIIHKHGEIKMVIRVLQMMKLLNNKKKFLIAQSSTADKIFLEAMDKDLHIDKNEKAIYNQLKKGLDSKEIEYLKNNARRAIEPFNEKSAPSRLKLWKRNFRSYEDRFNWNIQDVVTFKVSKVCNVDGLAIVNINKEKEEDLTCFFGGHKINIPISITIGHPFNEDPKYTESKEITFITEYALRKEVNKLARRLNQNVDYEEEEKAKESPFSLSYLRNSFGAMSEASEHNYSMLSVFWHCIYYFTLRNLPYDFILPSEDIDILSRYVDANRHINVCTDNPDEADLSQNLS